jgi:DNA-binding SARP family transcriptional activator
MVSLSIRLFGVFTLELEEGGRRRPLALPPRSAALLAMLSLSAGRRIHRSELLESLWHDDVRGGSAGCLSTALWRLRKALYPWSALHGEAILGDTQGGLRLREEPTIRVDVHEFQQRTNPALSRPGAELDDDEAFTLAEAIPLYQGDLLIDVADEWARRERERLRRRFVDALIRLMRHAVAREDLDEAIRRGRHLLELDPLREDIHRQLMACLVKQGQRAHALQQFESCRASLRSELAIAPMPETMALYRDVAAQSLAVREPAMPPTTPRAALRIDGEGNEEAARASLRHARRLLAEAERQLQLYLD